MATFLEASPYRARASRPPFQGGAFTPYLPRALEPDDSISVSFFANIDRHLLGRAGETDDSYPIRAVGP